MRRGRRPYPPNLPPEGPWPGDPANQAPPPHLGHNINSNPIAPGFRPNHGANSGDRRGLPKSRAAGRHSSQHSRSQHQSPAASHRHSASPNAGQHGAHAIPVQSKTTALPPKTVPKTAEQKINELLDTAASKSLSQVRQRVLLLLLLDSYQELTRVFLDLNQVPRH